MFEFIQLLDEAKYFADLEPPHEDLADVEFYEPLIAAEADAVDVLCEVVDAVNRFVRANKPVDGLRRSFAGAA